jgi:glucose-6-phosphate 1-dehydrogenase
MHCDLLIVGGEGDLAMRKLYPALYHLDHSGCLPDCLCIVAMVRREPSLEAFTARVRDGLGTGIDAGTWTRFASRLRTYDGDATSGDNLGGLAAKHFSNHARDLIVYLATPPAIFSPVCQALGGAGLIRANTRIVVEKPLGEDRASFHQINLELLALFAAEQIYRIDHYLGK